jgi:hypothetical protein
MSSTSMTTTRAGSRTASGVIPAQTKIQASGPAANDKPGRWYARASTLMLAALIAFTSLATSAAGLPRFAPETIAGTTMNLPRGWQRQQDEASLVLTRDAGDEDSPALALFAVRIDPARSPSPAALADAVLAQLDLPSQGVQAVLAEERVQQGALYRLHRLDESGQYGYLASYTHVDRAQGTLVHMMFSALDRDFVDLGGPLLPLVVYAGVDPAVLASPPQSRPQAPAANGCTASWACVEGMSAEEIALASQISRMSHETSMKILYNMDSGWCYSGEAGCD